MLFVRRRWLLTVAVSILATAVTLTGSVRFAHSEEPALANEILKALTPDHDTRSLTVSHPEATVTPEQAHLVGSLINKPADSLAPAERERLATIIKDKPSFDVKINFDFGSDKIGPPAARAVDEVGKALSNSKLTGNTFIIAGHTDGKGSDTYNRELSERRAESVKSYLIDKYKIPAANLIAVGYGKTMLKDPSDPFAPDNRRVQIVNMTDKSVAEGQ
jgi:outer membrane protein OmpA-like peptidoglycan-associated protein